MATHTQLSAAILYKVCTSNRVMIQPPKAPKRLIRLDEIAILRPIGTVLDSIANLLRGENSIDAPIEIIISAMIHNNISSINLATTRNAVAPTIVISSAVFIKTFRFFLFNIQRVNSAPIKKQPKMQVCAIP